MIPNFISATKTVNSNMPDMSWFKFEVDMIQLYIFFSTIQWHIM